MVIMLDIIIIDAIVSCTTRQDECWNSNMESVQICFRFSNMPLLTRVSCRDLALVSPDYNTPCSVNRYEIDDIVTRLREAYFIVNVVSTSVEHHVVSSPVVSATFRLWRQKPKI